MREETASAPSSLCRGSRTLNEQGLVLLKRRVGQVVGHVKLWVIGEGNEGRWVFKRHIQAAQLALTKLPAQPL